MAALLAPSVSVAQTAGRVYYVYDQSSRLVGVTNESGGGARYVYDAVGNITSIERYSSSQVSILGLSRWRGAVGATVEIYGTGFSSTAAENTVEFGTQPASVSTANPNRLTVTVPAGAPSSAVRVTTSGGTAVTATNFTVGDFSAPAVSSFTPNIAKEAHTISISGSAFENTALDNNVAINGIRATVTAASQTSISAKVPFFATSGPLTIGTPHGTATAGDLFIPPSPYLPADVAWTGRIGLDSNATVSVTTPNKVGLLVFDANRDQKISVQPSGSTMSYDLTVYGPDGAIVIPKTFLSTGTPLLESETLKTSGTYTILIDPNSTGTGSVNVKVNNSTDITGSISIDGPSVTADITKHGQDTIYTFTGAANQRVGLKASSINILPDGSGDEGRFSIQNADGLELDGDGLETGSYPYLVGPVNLPATGTYKVVVDPEGTNTGSVVLELFTVPADTNESISLDTPTTVSNTVAGQANKVTFTGSQGQEISIKVGTVSYSPTSDRPSLTLKNPDGSTLLTDDPLSSNSFFDATTLPANGTYTLTIDPEEASTGSTTFTVYDVTDPTGTMTIDGSSVAPSIGKPGQNFTYTFNGSANQRVAVKASNINVTPDNAGDEAKVWIYPETGSSLTVKGLETGTVPDLSVPVVLPSAGTYRVVFDPIGEKTGSATLNLIAVPPDTEQSITLGTATTVSNSVAGQNHKLLFSGTQDQKISIKAGTVSYTPSGSSPSLVVTKPDGTSLLSDSAISSNEFFDRRTLPASGTYSITIDPEATGTGSTTITVFDASDVNGSMTIGGPSVTATTNPGQEAWYTFVGSANQTVRLTATNINYSPSSSSQEAYMYMYKPDGSAVSSTSNKRLDNGSGPISMTDQVLPVSGTYKINLDPYNDRQGSATLSLSLVSPRLGSGSSAAQGQDYPTASPAPTPSATPASTPTPAATPTEPPGASPGNGADHRPDDVAPERMDAIRGWVPDKGSPPSGSPWQTLPPLEAEKGSTALAGQVLELNGLPLQGVTLDVDGKTATTDSTGRFLVSEIGAGEHEFAIDGTSANHAALEYGYFETRVEIEPGRTTVLDYTIWMPRLDTAHAVSLRDLRTRDVVVTSPRIPGLEVHLPKGSYLRGHDGARIYEVTLTEIPTDRPPFPMPVEFPVYFTMQPGGAYIYPRGAQVVYPNVTNELPGTRADFFNNDPDDRGWYIYGQGTVTEDGEQVVPDDGTRIYELAGSSFFPHDRGAPATGPNGEAQDGDPVDLSSGLFVYRKTDLALPGPAPIAITRTYRQLDQWSRDFGVGSTHPYDLWLDPSHTQYGVIDNEWIDLILPDGGRIRYDRIATSPTWLGKATKTPTAFFSSTLRWCAEDEAFCLKLRDGTVMNFPKVKPLSRITDRFGNSIWISRFLDKITQITSSSGRWVRFTYDNDDRITQLADNIGRTVNYTYYSDGRLWKVEDARGGITEYTYDASGRMDTIKDPRNIVFLNNDYDSAGRVSKQTQADGSFYTFNYTTDSNGKVTQTDVTGPTGFSRRVTFDPSGFMTSDIRAVGTSEQENITYVRDATSGLVQSVTDDAGRKTSFGYNSNGQPTSITRLADTANAETTTIDYETKYGRVSSVTEHGRTSTISYNDAANRITVTPAGPSGRSMTVDLNAAGLPKEITNALNQVTRLNYSLGDVTSIEDASGSLSHVFIDGGGRTTAYVDPLGNLSRSAYSNLNLVTSVTDPLGNQTSFTYDPNGNLKAVVDARTKTTTFNYDDLDLLDSRVDPLLKTETFDHNGLGQLVSHTDRRGKETHFRYDGRGRLKFTGFGAQGTGEQTTYQSTIDYSYDDGNRLSGLVDSHAGTITLAYNGLNQLTSETTPRGTVTYTYEEDLRDTMTVGSETAVDYGYDTGGRLTSITKGTQSVGLTYDALDRYDVVTLPNGLTKDHDFDSLGRVAAITYKDGATTVGALGYGYDKSSRRTEVTGSWARALLPDALSSATYNDANQLTNWGGTTLTYDDNGNLASDGTNTYTWNVRNQLSSISGGVTASFNYDSLGRRDEKVIGGATTRYLFDRLDVAQEKDGSGAVTANTLGGLGIDDVFSRTEGSATATFLTDALGSTVALADSTKAVTNEYSYEPYGKASLTGTTTNPFTFTGRETDPGTGLMHYRARYYSPGFGRFVSEDPIGFAGGLNMYGYVAGAPTIFTDPMGLVRTGSDRFEMDPGKPFKDLSGRKTNDSDCSSGGSITAAGGPVAAAFLRVEAGESAPSPSIAVGSMAGGCSFVDGFAGAGDQALNMHDGQPKAPFTGGPPNNWLQGIVHAVRDSYIWAYCKGAEFGSDVPYEWCFDTIEYETKDALENFPFVPILP